MNVGNGDLLCLAIAGHGGRRRWAEVSRFRASVSITGGLRALRGRPGLLEDVTLVGLTGQQRVTITPFPGPGLATTWQPDRQRINSVDGRLVAERCDPMAAFAGASCESPWDDFQIAHFAAEANWNYFVAPFLFQRDDFVTEETWPWREDARIWRTLLVTYPEAVVAHSRQQTYYFDETGLIRRLDYNLDSFGGGPSVHYPSRYRTFDGIMVPTRRVVYVRNPDGSPDRSSILVDIHVADVAFS